MDRKPLLGPKQNDDDLGVFDSDEEISSSDNEIDAIVTPTAKKNLTGSLAFAIAACVIGSSFMLGFNTGVLNTPEKVIKQFYNESYHKRFGHDNPDNVSAGAVTHPSSGNETSTGFLNSTELTILWACTVSIFAFGGMIGGLSAGYWCNRFGRKGALLRNNLLHVVAAALLFAAHFINSYEMMIAGRLLVGICAGINSGAAPLYLSEIAPVALRGFAGVFNQLAITSGVLVSQILGLDIVMGTDDLWPYILACTAVPVLIQLSTLVWCPESPRFLMLVRDDEEEAEKALMWLRKSVDVSEELEEMRSEAESQKHLPKFTVSKLFHIKDLREPLIISLVLQMTQQFSGINAVIYYSTEIFESADLSEDNAQYATLATGGVNVLMTFVSALIMDRAGRRRLLLIGVAGLFIFSTILATSLIVLHHYNDVQWLSYIAIVAVICYIISFATGPGAIPWFIVAEFFSQGPRSAAVSIATMMNWFSNFTVGIMFPILNDELIHEYSFLPFVVLLFIFLIFIYKKVPETKGKTIEEITAYFRNSVDSEKQHIIQTDTANYSRLQESQDSDS